MGMLRPEPVGGTDDWTITRSGRLYNPTARIWEDEDDFRQRIARGGMVPGDPLEPQDPAASLGQEFYGAGDSFGLQSTVFGGNGQEYDGYNQMAIPGINAAALPLDLDEDMPYYTDSSKGSELYKQAMQDPVMGAAMRARMGLDDVPMIGMPEQLEAEHLASMPEPFDEVERAKRDKGLKYQTGRWTGGTQYQWDTMDPEEKKRIMGTDAWVGGTSFVPTIGWQG